ncbi:MAG TPA: Lrp/AsnC family transcriptional regulator [Candidatus Ruthenibacterium merdigallinarum]|nr:Lrp/AsnC family transcriptional regulator [Candidatus Ruthenibacterium merdigallinarum]
MEKLLKILSENARVSLEDLAAMLGVAPAEAARMMDECEKNGLIHGYQALVDWEKADVSHVQALIELRVTPKRDCGFDEVAGAVAQFEEVDSVMLMSGGYDLMLMMSGRSFQEIALFVAKRLSTLDGVLSTTTHFILHTYKKDGVLYDGEAADERENQ